MSTRTVIEINHDSLADIISPVYMQSLFDDLRSGEATDVLGISTGKYGRIRVLAQRHHSEQIELVVK